ncbi:hypothetical protein CEXT_781071 [Caerostris extrusa]|uniref:Uncharacterized protein n=1 Tax=Caerostris extrusa TaxID=172846 RepID=A0AAV4TR36_CAEEX|nr:hypothetical protein CEXT_781071 [Caerostris extrusa]
MGGQNARQHSIPIFLAFYTHTKVIHHTIQCLIGSISTLTSLLTPSLTANQRWQSLSWHYGHGCTSLSLGGFSLIACTFVKVCEIRQLVFRLRVHEENSLHFFWSRRLVKVLFHHASLSTEANRSM